MSDIKADINIYLKRLKKAFNQTKQNMAKVALKSVLKESPVRLGAYVKSNQVGIGIIDTKHEPVIFSPFPNIPPAMPEVLAHALKKSLYTKKATEILSSEFKNDIYISNSIPYAGQVEFIGWEKTGPYHPYSKAILEFKAKTFLKSKTNAPPIE